MFFSLNCLIDGDDTDRMFTVEVPKNKNVSILKGLIKEKNPSSLGNVDVRVVDLFQVSILLGAEPVDVNLDIDKKLKPPHKKLSFFFDQIDDDHLHVIASVPGTSLLSFLRNVI